MRPLRRGDPLQAERITQALPDAELVIFEESAHMAAVEETERYIATVRSFLAGADLRNR